MLSFSVHEPPLPPADRLDRATSLVFIKDGFSWPAALFAPLWMLYYRLWWLLGGYFALSAALQLAGSILRVNQIWLALAVAGLHLLIGLEAAPLRIWSLGRRGWKNLGSVTGKTLAECERRFFEAWLPSQPIIAVHAPQQGDRGGWWRANALLGVRN